MMKCRRSPFACFASLGFLQSRNRRTGKNNPAVKLAACLTYLMGTLALARVFFFKKVRREQRVAIGGKPTGHQMFNRSGKIDCMDNQLPQGESPDTAAPDVPRHFSDETLQSLQELGEHLREIHTRLIFEGYTIQNGKISKPGVNQENHAGELEQRKSNPERHPGR